MKTKPERTVATCNKGNTAIVVDDHCYAIRNWNGNEWGWSAWIFREALEMLKTLPDNPDDALKNENSTAEASQVERLVIFQTTNYRKNK